MGIASMMLSLSGLALALACASSRFRFHESHATTCILRLVARANGVGIIILPVIVGVAIVDCCY